MKEEAEWYVAEIIVEITVAGDARNVVHRKSILLNATSPKEAYRKAEQAGEAENMAYDNPVGAKVTSRFVGLAELQYLYEAPGDGAEVGYREYFGVSADELRRWLMPKKDLDTFFVVGSTAEGPDYSSKEVLDEVERRWGPSTSAPPDKPA